MKRLNQEALKNIFNGCSNYELDVANSHYSKPENYLTHINQAEYPVVFTYNRNSSGTVKLMITIDEQLLWVRDLLSVEAAPVFVNEAPCFSPSGVDEVIDLLLLGIHPEQDRHRPARVGRYVVQAIHGLDHFADPGQSEG